MPMAKHAITNVIAGNMSYHDQVAEEYNAVMDGHRPNEWIRQRVKEKFCSLVTPGKVLDFGGGTGLDLGWLTKEGYEVVFCEPSVGMRSHAIAFATHMGLNVRFLEGAAADFTNWDSKGGLKVDAILSNFGPLNYIPDLSSLFRSAAGIIRPGGYFVLLVLHFPFAKRWKWHRRNALVSLLTGSTFKMYIPYKNHKQSVFVHTEKEIRETAAPWFGHGGTEVLAEHDFSLIHLVRHATAD